MMIILKILLFIFLALISIFLIMIIVPVKARIKAFYQQSKPGGSVTIYWIRPLLALQLRYIDLHSVLFRLEIFYIPISKTFHFEKNEPTISKEKAQQAEPEPLREKIDSQAQETDSQGKKKQIDTVQLKSATPSENINEGDTMSQAEWEELADTVSGGEVDFSRDDTGRFVPDPGNLPKEEKKSWRQQFYDLREKYEPTVRWGWQLMQNQLFPMAKQAFRIKIRRIEGEIGLPEPMQTFELQRGYITLMAFLNKQLQSNKQIRWRYDAPARYFLLDFIFSMNLLIIIIRLLLVWKEFKQARAAGIIKL
jgi:hypothetical protein